MQIENSGVSEKPHDDLIEKWINYKFNLTVKKVNDAFESFRFDLSTKAIYEFIWYEFGSGTSNYLKYNYLKRI